MGCGIFGGRLQCCSVLEGILEKPLAVARRGVAFLEGA